MRAAAVLLPASLLPLAFPSASGFLGNCTLALGYAVMALGLNVIVGFAGLLDLGYVAFYAIGAYTIGWLGSTFIAGVNHGNGWHVLVAGPAAHLPGVHLNFVLVLVAAVALTSLAGVAIGVPTLRLRGDYIAVVTLAFGEIIGQLARNGDELSIAGQPLTAGPKGITPIDTPAAFSALDLRPWYWVALALASLAVGVSLRLRDSRLGRAWAALREHEDVAASLGIPIAKTKLLAYGTGAAFGGIAGVFLGSFDNIVSASQFEFPFSILILSMVAIGGLGSIPGAVAGAFVLTFANYWLLPRVIDLSQLSYGLYGLLLVVLTLLRYWPSPVLGSREGSRRMPAGRWSVLTNRHSGSRAEPYTQAR
jgi:branched-chain amino acid transport system permease protein